MVVVVLKRVKIQTNKLDFEQETKRIDNQLLTKYMLVVKRAVDWRVYAIRSVVVV